MENKNNNNNSNDSERDQEEVESDEEEIEAGNLTAGNFLFSNKNLSTWQFS